MQELMAFKKNWFIYQYLKQYKYKLSLTAWSQLRILNKS